MKTLSAEIQRGALRIILERYLGVPAQLCAKVWRILQR
jgi:hypothetical protein